jgi:hypothetical protein
MTPLSNVGFIVILRQNKTRRSGHALLELLLNFPALDCTQAKQGRAEKPCGGREGDRWRSQPI